MKGHTITLNATMAEIIVHTFNLDILQEYADFTYDSYTFCKNESNPLKILLQVAMVNFLPLQPI